MKYLKMFGLAALAAALMAFFAVGTASATIIESTTGVPLKAGTVIKAENEGHVTLHPPIGSVTCAKSHIEGTTTNDGGSGINVKGTVKTVRWSECNGTVTTLKEGSLEVASNGALTSSGTEVTVSLSGFHCIFSTSNTPIGTVTSSPNHTSDATFHIKAQIERTGGTSGIFCGSTAEWTGSYKVTSPTPLFIT